jgi:protoheme IX farnesyltransferase
MAFDSALTYDFAGIRAESDLSAATVRDFIALLKPRVMTLVVFTAIAGMVVAPGNLHPFLALVAVFCIAIGSGAAGAINMWYERDIDAIMSRTKTRPLPAGRIQPDDALAFGVILTLLSVMLMGLALNWLAAGLLAFASFFYIFVYTIWLKRRTPQNIVIGGAAGAFPPMIGWAAVTGSMDVFPIVLFAIVFFWTPPHFWALALYKNTDYKKAKIPMLPVIAGLRRTKIEMLLYTLVLAPVCFLPYAMGDMGIIYLTGAVGLNLGFIFCALRVLYREDMRPAKSMFGYSIFYLFALFSLVMIDGAIYAVN